MSGAPKPLLSVSALERRFGGGRSLLGRSKPAVHAVQGVSFDLRAGETLGVVGESGCGKSTLARLLVGLDRPTGGRIALDGEDLSALAQRDHRALARQVQYVFQDPVSALNPRKTVRALVEAPMRYLLGLDRAARAGRLEELSAAVGLGTELLERYPHELSGGQAQRIGIARALAADPRIVVLDEPVSALDVSIQAQVLNLLADLKGRFGLTYLFIGHDLSVVEGVSDRTAVMYFGRIVELGTRERIFRRPRHPYTRLLLDSVPVPGRRRVRPEQGDAELPDPCRPPPGCAFAPRCPRRRKDCTDAVPELEIKDAAAHRVACFNPLTDR